MLTNGVARSIATGDKAITSCTSLTWHASRVVGVRTVVFFTLLTRLIAESDRISCALHALSILATDNTVCDLPIPYRADFTRHTRGLFRGGYHVGWTFLTRAVPPKAVLALGTIDTLRLFPICSALRYKALPDAAYFARHADRLFSGGPCVDWTLLACAVSPKTVLALAAIDTLRLFTICSTLRHQAFPDAANVARQTGTLLFVRDRVCRAGFTGATPTPVDMVFWALSAGLHT
jgi:hypothetical protein